MTPTRYKITLGEGVGVNVLLTPALYGVARSRGIDLALADGRDATAVTRTYAKIAYCGALNAWEVDAVDDPDKGAFPYRYEDFDTWAWSSPDALTSFIDAVLVAFTGKGLKATAAEAVKKKTRAAR